VVARETASRVFRGEEEREKERKNGEREK